jgi:polysaccharide pyruvyl transferase WcaK-like protein
MIMIGGDNLSLDYTIVGLLAQTGFSEVFMSDMRPMILWAASVGPFSADPIFERHMKEFLSRLDLITVRETATLDYLRSIGITENVQLVADPAFLLKPQPLSLDEIVRTDVGTDLLGLNLSPLVDDAQYGRQQIDAKSTATDIVRFVEKAVQEFGLSVVLVPHVDPLGQPYGTSDTEYMKPIFERLRHLGNRVALAPSTLNAAQLKYVIGNCRYFIGARTHSTIASLSSGIPTISIAYSVKARGLNRDLFGHERYVLPTPQLSLATLIDGLKLLIADESDIRALLQQKIPTWQERARLSGQLLAKYLP